MLQLGCCQNTITSIAGSSTSGSYSGDNGAATSAGLRYPYGIALDSSGINIILFVTFDIFLCFCSPNYTQGNVYISDSNNSRIRKITVSTGIITTIAGNGNGGYTGDNGAATSATFNSPTGIAVDSSGIVVFFYYFRFILFLFIIGNVYIADQSNHCIRKVTVATDIITTIAGIGSVGYGGDNGQATSATLWWPNCAAIDTSGTHYCMIFHGLSCFILFL